ncbi:MAG: sigma-70 family RNA polymerase sigma factor [Anaerolineae bacterium]|nr:sigma-70 family RNA polymerase sigma factor [Anaerolineae bacterium]
MRNLIHWNAVIFYISPIPPIKEVDVNRVEEQRLVKLAQNGHTDAFAQLYRANVQLVFRYLYYRLNDVQLAEDFTADVFTRAFKDMKSYQDMGKPLMAWLYRIAHARLVDYYRQSGRRGIDGELDEAIQVQSSPEGADANLLRKQMAQALHQAIAQLIPSQQQVVLLRFIEEKNLEETALIMDKKANAIKALQHRALKTLGQILKQMGFDSDEFLAGLS